MTKVIELEKKHELVTLAEGSGGQEMDKLIHSFAFFNKVSNWKNSDNDSATYDLGNGKTLVFTTDSFTVDPLFFPGGNIGHLAMCGTINDLAVMGVTRPLGISTAFIIEEGLPKDNLEKITSSIDKISKETKIPIVTGDTKVVEKGKIERIMITTSGIGMTDTLLTKKIEIGDKIIISGGIGEHAVALLSKRFDYKTNIVTDSKPLIDEITKIRHLIKIAKDPTRGGLSAALNDICAKNKVGMLIDEESVPAKDEVRKVVDLLGINLYDLACEGRFVCVANKDNADKIVDILKQFNPDASIIGDIINDNKVMIKTFLGSTILPPPTGRIIPRIC